MGVIFSTSHLIYSIAMNCAIINIANHAELYIYEISPLMETIENNLVKYMKS
jgi:hypothetical protein